VELLRAFWSQPAVSFDGRFDRIDRATLNPRPGRAIPIWMGGFSDPALRRAARAGDGFIFVDGASDTDALLARLRGFLAEAGREAEPFGLQCNMLTAKGVDAVRDRVARWRDAGGSHAAVSTMGQGFATIDDHVAYLERVAGALTQAGAL
jgi:alkanesulfonate monooxygenase SsuD/methylene tetrahydromethanopterin reductase-like flavin-dependent oxidoreductase (luciferase family)